jgi:cellulose biosynthesis protein BcsQ
MHTPLNITVLAKKGGVGKTTLSLLLYEAFRQAEKNVYIQDWDSQGTSTKALGLIIGEQKITRQQADIIIWDTPPTLEHTATATAARSADIGLAVTTLPLSISGKPMKPRASCRIKTPKQPSVSSSTSSRNRPFWPVSFTTA